jgi:hypothetical protein
MTRDNDNQRVTTDIRQFFSPNYTVSKGQFGLVLLIVGGIALTGLLLLDVIGGGREGGIGPAQQIGIGLSALMTLLGLSLLPFGEKPL